MAETRIDIPRIDIPKIEPDYSDIDMDEVARYAEMERNREDDATISRGLRMIVHGREMLHMLRTVRDRECCDAKLQERIEKLIKKVDV